MIQKVYHNSHVYRYLLLSRSSAVTLASPSGGRTGPGGDGSSSVMPASSSMRARAVGLPSADTPPGRLRDAVRDLYKYEIRRLRERVVSGDIPKREYAGHVIELRKRYPLLSIPTDLWVESKP